MYCSRTLLAISIVKFTKMLHFHYKTQEVNLSRRTDNYHQTHKITITDALLLCICHRNTLPSLLIAAGSETRMERSDPTQINL